MKVRAARAADVGTADVTIVPLFDDLAPPAGLGRRSREIVARMAREHRASERYQVSTHVGLGREGRIVMVGAGARADHDTERARGIASAGIRSLWRTDMRSVALHVAADGIGEERAPSRRRSRGSASRCGAPKRTGPTPATAASRRWTR